LKLTQRQGEKIEMEDHDIRAAMDRHWAASDANDFEAEHQIYQEDAVLEYPQSGERIRSRRNIQASRSAQPTSKRFTVRRILGAADLWITELVITYDARPSYTVSIMEFRDGKGNRGKFPGERGWIYAGAGRMRLARGGIFGPGMPRRAPMNW
jgi:hypothetical protein